LGPSKFTSGSSFPHCSMRSSNRNTVTRGQTRHEVVWLSGAGRHRVASRGPLLALQQHMHGHGSADAAMGVLTVVNSNRTGTNTMLKSTSPTQRGIWRVCVEGVRVRKHLVPLRSHLEAKPPQVLIVSWPDDALCAHMLAAYALLLAVGLVFQGEVGVTAFNLQQHVHPRVELCWRPCYLLKCMLTMQPLSDHECKANKVERYTHSLRLACTTCFRARSGPDVTIRTAELKAGAGAHVLAFIHLLGS
jgi:hypothetical protein